MTDIFLQLLNMSFTASFLIVAVLIARMILRKAPRWTICLLWGLVGIRLICPITIESSWSLVPRAEWIPAEFESVETVWMENEGIQLGINEDFTNEDSPTDAEMFPMGNMNMDNITELRESVVTEDTFITENSAIKNEASLSGITLGELPGEFFGLNMPLISKWMSVAAMMWLIGLIIMVLYVIISYVRLFRRVSASLAVDNQIYICDNIDSPFIFGMWNPRIYLPSGMPEATEKYVIAHEKAHLKRLDHFWKTFGFLLLSIYWFHPLVWVSYILLCKDIELACDEKVIRDLKSEEKKEYSMALLTCSTSRRIIAVCPLAFGEVSVKERVKSILNYKKASFRMIVAVCIILLGVGFFFMTNPADKERAGADSEAQEVQSSAGEFESENGETVAVRDDLKAEGDATAESVLTENEAAMLAEKYIDISQLGELSVNFTADNTFEDRHFVCEGIVHNELERMVYQLYYAEAAGDYDSISDLLGESPYLQIAFSNEQKQFAEGNYMSEYRIHELTTLTAYDVQKADLSAQQSILQQIEEYNLMEYAIVKVDISWKHNEKSLSMAPQLGDGRYLRYYLLAKSEALPEFRIYEVYWEDFAPVDVSQIMDRILAATPLEAAIPLTSTANLPSGDQLYFLDETASGNYTLYGFHSDEYRYTGLLINYKINGEDNWNYLDDIENWIGYEFPRIAETEDGALILTYCFNGGSNAHMDRFFYLIPHETGTLERYELTYEMIREQTEALVAFDLYSKEETVFVRESILNHSFAAFPYADALNGQEEAIKDVILDYARVRFLPEPALLIVGVGLAMEESVTPTAIGDLAFRIKAEPDGSGVKFVLYDVSNYFEGVEELLSAEEKNTRL